MPIRNTVAAFEADLEEFARLMDVDFGKVKRKVALDIFAKVTMRTPVDSGRARASWAVSDAVPSQFVQPEGLGVYPAEGPVFANFADPFETVWVVNNLPYIEALEWGHSQQSPQGMVRIALAEVEAELLSARGEPR